MFEDEVENKVWMQSFLSESDLDFLNKSFLDGYSDIKIGEMFKCHRNTVAKRKRDLS